MASTTFPCPACHQVQRVEHDSGQAVESVLCAACEEEATALGLKGTPLQRARKLIDGKKIIG